MGTEKALVEFGGKPLIACVIDRLLRQVAAIAISANGDPRRFARFELPVIADPPAYRDIGPLAGIAAGLALAEAGGHRLVLTVPCDAPFAPLDLASRLSHAAAANRAAAAVAAGPGGLEPLFALWRSDLRLPLEQALERGARSPREFLAACNAFRLSFATTGEEDPFVNLNSPVQLATARARLAARREVGAGP
jgi:molybdopterin-guanine dinucleotide biosynthesis protein A